MRRPRPPNDGTPLWLVILLIAVFGTAMFLSGYVVGQIFC